MRSKTGNFLFSGFMYNPVNTICVLYFVVDEHDFDIGIGSKNFTCYIKEQSMLILTFFYFIYGVRIIKS